MVESVPGEVIAGLASVAICAPYFYQVQASLGSAGRSPLRAASWHLWALGFLGLGIFFGHMPRGENHGTAQRPELGDVPTSPVVLAVGGIVACLLCQLCWALDHASSRRRGAERMKEVAKMCVLVYVADALVYVVTGLARGSLVSFKPFYRGFLAIIAFVFVALFAVGSLLAVLSQSLAQLRHGGPEVAGLYWMPVAMQTLGFFTGIIDLVLVYGSVEWLGVGLLGSLLGLDVLYIIGSRLKARQSQQYGSVPDHSTEHEIS